MTALEGVRLAVVGLLTFVAGFLWGWHNGHLSGVEYALKLLLGLEGPEDSDLLAYTGDRIPPEVRQRMNDLRARFGKPPVGRPLTVREELQADEVYQAQLKAQARGNGQKRDVKREPDARADADE